jgi:CRP-like cAMP-binding protein
MLNELFSRMAVFAPLGSRDKVLLAGAGITRCAYSAREELLRPGSIATGIHFVLSGLACRYSLLQNGRRQITSLLLPGDIVGEEALIHRPCVDTVTAFTRTDCAYIPMRTVASWSASCSALAQGLWGMQALQASISRQWVVNVGSRPALQRVAHFFCETITRSPPPAASLGLRLTLPITQIELADITAMTPVHVNRILMQLKRERLAIFKHGVLQIPDLAALCSLAAFEPEYLAPLQSWTDEWQLSHSDARRHRMTGASSGIGCDTTGGPALTGP